MAVILGDAGRRRRRPEPEGRYVGEQANLTVVEATMHDRLYVSTVCLA